VARQLSEKWEMRNESWKSVECTVELEIFFCLLLLLFFFLFGFSHVMQFISWIKEGETTQQKTQNAMKNEVRRIGQLKHQPQQPPSPWANVSYGFREAWHSCRDEEKTINQKTKCWLLFGMQRSVQFNYYSAVYPGVAEEA